MKFNVFFSLYLLFFSTRCVYSALLRPEGVEIIHMDQNAPVMPHGVTRCWSRIVTTDCLYIWLVLVKTHRSVMFGVPLKHICIVEEITNLKLELTFNISLLKRGKPVSSSSTTGWPKTYIHYMPISVLWSFARVSSLLIKSNIKWRRGMKLK